MMTRPALLLTFAQVLALGLACAPPPPLNLGDTDTDVEVDVDDPSVKIVYPGSDVGEWALDADCHLRMVVATDIDAFELVDFRDVPEADSRKEGQGHWHVTIEPLDFYTTVVTQSIEIDFFNPEEPTQAKGVAGTASTVLVGASLVHSDHSPVDCPTCDDQIEFMLTDPLDCVPAE